MANALFVYGTARLLGRADYVTFSGVSRLSLRSQRRCKDSLNFHSAATLPVEWSSLMKNIVIWRSRSDAAPRPSGPSSHSRRQ